MITCNDIYRMYQSRKPESEIQQAFREVAVDDRDGLYGNRTPLHLACLSADETAVRILIERGANINVKDDEGYTPLCRLGMCQDKDRRDNIRNAASLLLENGANVPSSAKGTTALIEAVRNRNFGMADIIVDSGCRIDSTNNDGENVLHTACISADDIQGDMRRVERKTAEALSMNYPEERKIHIKAEAETEIGKLRKLENELLNLVHKLLDSGCIDPDDKTNYGETAWDIAIGRNAVKIAALFSGSNTETDDALQQTGGMDIFQAMYNNDMEVVEALLHSGIELQTVCEHEDMYDFHGKSPLACAFAWFSELPKAAEMLLDAGADPNWHFPDENTAFAVGITKDWSSRHVERYVRILKQMRSNGWDIEQPADCEGNTALALACRYVGIAPGKAAIRFLLENGADVNAANPSGQTTCMILYGGHPARSDQNPYGWSVDGEQEAEILEMLLEAEADTGKKDNWGNTILHYIAASCRDTGVRKAMELMSDFGLPDSDVVNNEGKTAMDVAVEWDNETMVKLLLKYT